MKLNRKLWLSSAAYQRGYSDGKADGAASLRPAVIRLHMDDGRVLMTDDVIRELRIHGFDIVPYKGAAA